MEHKFEKKYDALILFNHLKLTSKVSELIPSNY